MIYFGKEQTKAIRDCNLEWHCCEVVLSQPFMSDGYELCGYGIVKSQINGGLYLEFICLKSNRRLKYDSPIPEDRMEEKQALVMNAKTIDGVDLVSEKLSVETSFQQMITDFPKLYRIGLKEISFCESLEQEDDNSRSYLYFEFNEKISIPFNINNTTESSLCSSSSDWNQADREFNDIKIKIIKHNDYMQASASGSSLDTAKIRDAIAFYLGFSSGVLVQPYYEHLQDSSISTRIIRSIDRKKINRDIPPPMHGSIKTQNEYPLDPHYQLLENIYDVSINSPDYFESTYSQWKRIWHSFFSNDISVPMLTVSIAVDGILNDIFIPELTKRLMDMDFEIEKENIVEIIRHVEGVSDAHLKTITQFVERWGNIRSKKALQYMVEIGLIEKKQLNCWEKLRNSSAHPKLVVQDEQRKRKNIERTVICLGLFYRLSLNVYSYKGPQYSYEKAQDNDLTIKDYIKVLH